MESPKSKANRSFIPEGKPVFIKMKVGKQSIRNKNFIDSGMAQARVGNPHRSPTIGDDFFTFRFILF